jgi:oligopeptide/dipeptide ABC transporter ATP-binding protein
MSAVRLAGEGRGSQHEGTPMGARVQVHGLVVSYASNDGPVVALDGVDLAIEAGETVGIVGESGSGKSTLGLALGRLLAPNASFDRGEIFVDGRSVLACSKSELRALRRDQLGFVFQNPMSALDPTMRIGRQVALTLDVAPASAAVPELLRRVGLADPHGVAASFPHELSGGMAQRVVIGLGIARRPRVLIADEPTASLDASIQGMILDLLLALGRETGAAVVVMTHDLRMAARRCARILVMYGGRVVEAGASGDVFGAPRHPYSQALVRAAAGNEGPDGRLEPIPGLPPLLRHTAGHCAFAPRCRHAQDVCRAERPVAVEIEGRVVACHFARGFPAAPAGIEDECA